ncbi:MAG TPA: VacJ family lipoprotein [Candidatus Limnocylindria bacterium]|nr:VacJ family lipoprotein [Candidatus Limnocylindria bacterium]
MARGSFCSYLLVALLLISPATAFAADAQEKIPAGETTDRETGAAPETGIAEGDTADSAYTDTGSGEDPFGAEVSPPPLADPLEPVNRALFVFNDKAYFWVMKPVAQGYRAVVPEVMRISVRNFFSNLAMPIRFVNNLLQGKIRNSGVELLRFALNTTAGIGGLFDPAKDDFRLVPRDEDLGQTFGTYGFGHGLYIVLPLLGPSSLRDAVGRAGDSFLDPVNYVEDTEVAIGAKVLNAENEISLRIGEYEDLKKSAIDPYIAVRDAYSQYREKKVKE